MRSGDLILIRVSYCSRMDYRLSRGSRWELDDLGLSLYFELRARVWTLRVKSLTLIDVDVLLIVVNVIGGRLLYLLLAIRLLVLLAIRFIKIITVAKIEIVLVIILYDRIEIFIHRFDSCLIISFYLINRLFKGLNDESWRALCKFSTTLDWTLLYTVIIGLHPVILVLTMTSIRSIHV